MASWCDGDCAAIQVAGKVAPLLAQASELCSEGACHISTQEVRLRSCSVCSEFCPLSEHCRISTPPYFVPKARKSGRRKHASFRRNPSAFMTCCLNRHWCVGSKIWLKSHLNAFLLRLCIWCTGAGDPGRGHKHLDQLPSRLQCRDPRIGTGGLAIFATALF